MRRILTVLLAAAGVAALPAGATASTLERKAL
jgi:hypothetical protein